MKQKYSAFSYKNGNSFLHRIPAIVKILLLPAVNILIFNLHWYVALGFMAVQLIAAVAVKFTFRELLEDLKPVLYYAILLYITNFTASFCTVYFSPSETPSPEFLNCLEQTAKTVFKNFTTLQMLLKLFCIMQSASLIFKTSTSLQIRDGFAAIEKTFRKIFHLNEKITVTNTITLFVCFIPMVYKIWNQSKKAWFARQGKHNLKMYSTLLPVLFSVGMKQAFNSAKAMQIREK